MEADLRHAGLIVSQLGLTDAKELTCPAADEIKRDNDDEELNAEYTTEYKSIVARANYLSTDRPDIQYAVKKLATSMSKPTNRNWQELKTLGRFLKGKPRLIIKYKWQVPINVPTSYSDSDWAGDRKSRKSTSGGIVTIGSHYIKSLSKNRSVIARSSAEAELYAIIKTSSETLGIISILKDWNMLYKADIMADASAALGIIGRTGLGKLRHIDTSYLWLQQESIKKKLKMNKVPGTENPADMNTKGLSGEEIAKYIKMLNMGYKEGRSELAPEVHQVINKQKCNRFNSTSLKVTHRVRIKENQQNKETDTNHRENPQLQQPSCICGCHDCWMCCETNKRS